jgi:DNA-binding NarL/FixJ family response regulator
MKVLVADDHEVLRSCLRSLLVTQADIEVVEAADGASAVRAAFEQAPDVVVMDLSMPIVSGVEATRRILAANPNVKVLMLSGYQDVDKVRESLDAGALGYVLKDAAYDELIDAVRAVAAKEQYVSLQIRAELG